MALRLAVLLRCSDEPRVKFRFTRLQVDSPANLKALEVALWCSGNAVLKASGYSWFQIALESKPVNLNSVRLPRGVTVTQRPLEALFLVRIQAGQPFINSLVFNDLYNNPNRVSPKV